MIQHLQQQGHVQTRNEAISENLKGFGKCRSRLKFRFESRSRWRLARPPAGGWLGPLNRRRRRWRRKRRRMGRRRRRRPLAQRPSQPFSAWPHLHFDQSKPLGGAIDTVQTVLMDHKWQVLHDDRCKVMDNKGQYKKILVLIVLTNSG